MTSPGCECEAPDICIVVFEFYFRLAKNTKASKSWHEIDVTVAFLCYRRRGCGSFGFLHDLMMPPFAQFINLNQSEIRVPKKLRLVHIMTSNRRCFDATVVLDCEGSPLNAKGICCSQLSFYYITRFCTFTTERVTSSQ